MKAFRYKLRIPALIVFSLIIFELFFFYLFPSGDLEFVGYVSFILVFIIVGAGTFTYIILTTVRITKKRLSIAFTFVISIILVITFYPVPYGGPYVSNNSWGRIIEYFNTYFDYPEAIRYEDLAYGNEAHRIAASVKYRDSLPEDASMLTIHKEVDTDEYGNSLFNWDTFEWRFYFEFKEGKVIYDTEQLGFEQRNDGWWLILNPNSSNATEIFFTDRNFSLKRIPSPPGWGYDGYYFNITNYSFIPESGAEKLLSSLLSSK